jgi:hypothetical protein
MRLHLAQSALLAADLGARLYVREVVELPVYGAASWASAAAMIDDPDILAAAARERIGPIPGAEVDVVGPLLVEFTALSDEIDVMACGSRQHGSQSASSWAARATIWPGSRVVRCS